MTVVDIFQATAIRACNSFSCLPLSSAEDKNINGRTGIGIWIKASYTNHACDSNAHYTFMGDLIIVRATRDIAKGTEITIGYGKLAPDHTLNRKEMQKGWGFKCECDLCSVEMKTGGRQVSRRKQLIKETGEVLEDKQKIDNDAFTKAQKLYKQLEATYDKNLFKGMPRLGLIKLGLWLVTNKKHPSRKSVVDGANEVLRNCGYIVERRDQTLDIDYTHCLIHSAAIDAAVHAARSSFFLGEHAIDKQYEDLAKRLYVTLHGVLTGYAERYPTWR